MTEIGELVAALNVLDETSDDKCPFCYKKAHPFKFKANEPNPVVKSVPKQLGCSVNRRKTGNYPYTTARHHLISALQCFGQLRRLVRMATLVGYDINDPPNGIGLPTTHHSLKYTHGEMAREKYGNFDDDEKEEIAFKLMKELGAQWHVGHHAFEVLIPGDWDNWGEAGGEEGGGDDRGHMVSYDTTIISQLLDLMDNWVATNHCEAEDPKDDLKADMDELSGEIKAKLEAFGGPSPSGSSPLFVSRMAYNYARGE